MRRVPGWFNRRIHPNKAKQALHSVSQGLYESIITKEDAALATEFLTQNRSKSGLVMETQQTHVGAGNMADIPGVHL